MGIMGEYSVERVEVELETWDRITFPNGAQMIYVEVPGFENARNHHTYWRAHPDWKRGKQLAGASSLVSTFDLRQDKLQQWIGTQAATTGEADPSKFYKDRGTRVHSVLEALACGAPFPNVDEMPESDRGYARGLMRWWERRRPKTIACEQFVLHGDLGFAGHYDLRAVIDGKVTLLDLKTSKSLYAKNGAQLVAYDYAAEWCGLGVADDLFVLQVDKHGNFYEVPAFVTRESFERALRVREDAKDVERQQKERIKQIKTKRLLAEAA